tara:strand:+ start:2228 stop:2506 length:279 start_codon:yes stop_codon:yes gene_type:complete
MTVKKLKEKCRELGLKVSGTKAELKSRIKNPTKSDFVDKTKESWIKVSIGWSDKKTPLISNLKEKGFAKVLCYATDRFYYMVRQDKWLESLK